MSERLERGKNWPQEFGTSEPQYGLFRKPFAQKPPASQKWRNKRPGNSAEHLRLLRLLPCSVSPDNRDIQVHHLKGGPAIATRGMGMKAPDMWGVPLSARKHLFDLEAVGSRHEFAWFMSYGINPYDLAHRLWCGTGDRDRMARILLTHKLAGTAVLLDMRKAGFVQVTIHDLAPLTDQLTPKEWMHITPQQVLASMKHRQSPIMRRADE